MREKQEEKKKKQKRNKEETCTQAERDKKFGKGWRWNTRNCESLKSRADIKRCRRDKLKRCIQKEKEKKKNFLSESAAKLKCKELSKRKKNRSSRKKKLKSS